MKKWLYPFLYSVACGILVLHAASPTGLIARLLPFSIELFMGVALLLLSILYWTIPTDARFSIYSHWYLPVVATFISVTMRIVELLTHINFVFSLTHIDPNAFALLSFFITGLAVTTLGKKGLKRRPDRAIFVFGLWMIHIVLLGYYNYPFYNSLSGEDKLFEWMTFTMFLVGGLVFIKTAARLAARQKKTFLTWCVMLYVLVGAVGFVGSAGEEISWGQRLLLFETPEAYVEVNSQGEFNLHNNELIFDKIYHLYGLICLFVLVSPIAYLVLKKRVSKTFAATFLRLMTFRWYHGIYFIPTLIYVAYRIYYQTSRYDIWEEATEVLFATGMLLYAVHVYWVERKLKVV
jgi:hypothetical protein